jgi:hypothetical protein
MLPQRPCCGGDRAGAGSQRVERASRSRAIWLFAKVAMKFGMRSNRHRCVHNGTDIGDCLV